jgi:serine/threonine protein kinase
LKKKKTWNPWTWRVEERENECTGESGETKLYTRQVEVRGSWRPRENTAVKSFRINIEPEDKYKKLISLLIRQAEETVIHHDIKYGGHPYQKGNEYITEINCLISEVPDPEFLRRMMNDCLGDKNKLLLPSIQMEDSGIDLLGITKSARWNSQTKEDKKRLMKELAEGISYMNKNLYFHHDIKELNICAKEVGERYTIRIIDFGMVRRFSSEPEAREASQDRGSLCYAYPFSKRCDLCDLWAYMIVVTNVFFDRTPATDPVMKVYEIGNKAVQAFKKNPDLLKKSSLPLDEHGNPWVLWAENQEFLNEFIRNQQTIFRHNIDGSLFQELAKIFEDYLLKNNPRISGNQIWSWILYGPGGAE